MQILNNEKNSMLIGMLSMDTDKSGFYKEVSEEKLSKKVKNALSKLGGYGVSYEDYFRSNTAGETLHRYFKKIADRIEFEPIQHDILNKITDDTTMDQGIAILTMLDNELLFNVSKYESIRKNVEYVNFEFVHYFKNEDMIALNHEYIEHSNYFLGRDKACIRLNADLKKSEAEKILLDKKKFTLNDIGDLFCGVNTVSTNWNYSLREDNYFYGN